MASNKQQLNVKESTEKLWNCYFYAEVEVVQSIALPSLLCDKWMKMAQIEYNFKLKFE